MKKHLILTILVLLLSIAIAALAGEPFMLKDIYPAAGSLNLAVLTNVNGTLFFMADDANAGM
jgi:hypothetical protein